MKKILLLISISLVGFSLTAQEKIIKLSSTTESITKSEPITKMGKFTLWYQEESATGWASQDFGEGMNQYSCQAADDFVVTNGPWSITVLSCYGSGGSGGGLENVHVYFYEDDSAIPGALIQEFITIPCVTENKSGTVTIELPETVVLENGTYWVSIVADMDADPLGQWYWNEAVTSNGALWNWKNPNDGFGTGYTDWGTGQDALGSAEHDLSLGIYGIPASDSWITSYEIMPEATVLGSSAYNPDDNLLYTFGGEPTYTGLFIYDVENDSWASGAALLGDSNYGSAVYANGVVYANQGQGPTGYTTAFWAYDVNDDSWSVKQNIPEAIAWGDMAYCEANNVIYFAGGHDMSAFKDEVYVYSIEHNEWETAIPLPEKKAGGKIVCDNETLFYIGGANEDGSTLSNKVFKGIINPNDAADISWSAVSSMPVAVYKHQLANFGSGKLIVNGGNDGVGGYNTAIPSTFIYDIYDDEWTQVADKNTAVNYGACGTFHYDGNSVFVVASGYTGSENIKYAEMYYAETKYRVTFKVDGGNGVITATSDENGISNGDYITEGSDITFYAIADTGYKVKAWVVNGTTLSHTDNSYTYPGLDKDVDVAVEFEATTLIEEVTINDVNVYPNPFRDEIIISNASAINHIIITNIMGTEIMNIKADGDKIINTKNLAAGIYFLSFVSEDGERIVRKLVKQ